MEIAAKDKKEKNKSILLYISFILWFATEMIVLSTVNSVFGCPIDSVNTIVALFVLLLLTIQILFVQKYSFKELSLLFVISLPIIISAYNSDHLILASAWLFTIASKYVNIDKIIDIAFWVQSLMMAIIFSLLFFGRINEIITYRGSTIRHSCGFVQANFLGMMVFQLVAMHFYRRRNKIGIIDFVILIVAGLFTYLVPNSQSAFWGIILFFILAIIYVLVHKNEKVLSKICRMLIRLFLSAALFSIFLTYMNIRKSNVLMSFDRALSWRFSTGHMTLKYYGVTLLGQKIYSIVKRPIIGYVYRFYLDNAYMAILIRYGVVVLIFFLLLYSATMIYFIRNRNYLLVFILFVFGIYGIMETNLFSLSKNVFLISMSYPFFSKEYTYPGGTDIAENKYRVSKPRRKILITI